MASGPVNLRQFRKRKAREEKERQAEANRIAYGRTKAEKSVTKAENLRSLREHDRKRLEKPHDTD